MYRDYCLHGGLSHFFLDSCERVAPSKALHTIPAATGVLLSSDWCSLICSVCGTLYSFSFCSSFKLQQHVDKNCAFGTYAKPL